jgi:hypothetical protein
MTCSLNVAIEEEYEVSLSPNMNGLSIDTRVLMTRSSSSIFCVPSRDLRIPTEEGKN